MKLSAQRNKKNQHGLLALVSLILLLMHTQLQATATDSTSINIQVVHHPQQQKIKLTGSINSNNFRPFNIYKEAERHPPAIKLGTFGIHSNIRGKCQLGFTSTNQFRLKHSHITNRLARYQVSLDKKRIGIHNKLISQANCHFDSSTLELVILDSPIILKTDEAGYFWDTLMITVTAP